MSSPRKEKKKKEKGDNVPKTAQKKEWKELDELPMCKCTWTFLSIKQLHFLPSVFSLIWGENFGEKTFWWARGEKT